MKQHHWKVNSSAFRGSNGGLGLMECIFWKSLKTRFATLFWPPKLHDKSLMIKLNRVHFVWLTVCLPFRLELFCCFIGQRSFGQWPAIGWTSSITDDPVEHKSTQIIEIHRLKISLLCLQFTLSGLLYGVYFIDLNPCQSCTQRICRTNWTDHSVWSFRVIIVRRSMFRQFRNRRFLVGSIFEHYSFFLLLLKEELNLIKLITDNDLFAVESFSMLQEELQIEELQSVSTVFS